MSQKSMSSQKGTGKKSEKRRVEVTVSVQVCVKRVHVCEKAKKFQRRESNPRLKRERLECYRLHHIGLLLEGEEVSSVVKRIGVVVCVCRKKDPASRIRTSDLRKSITTTVLRSTN